MADRYSKIDFGSGTDTPTGDTVYQGFTKTNDFMDGVENDLDLIENQLNELNITSNTHTNLIDDLGADFAVLDGKVDALNTSVNDDIGLIESKIDTIENELNNYYNKTDVDNLLNNKVNTSQLSSYATVIDLNNGLATKANQLTTYTKVEVDNLIQNVEVDLTDYYNKTEIDTNLSNYYTKNLTYNQSQIDQFLNTKANQSDVYMKVDTYSKSEIDTKIDEIEAGDVDLTNYYNKTDVDNLLDNKVNTSQLSSYATVIDLNSGLATKANQLTTYTKTEVDSLLNDVEVDLTGYATENYVDSAINNIVFPTTDLTDYYNKTEVNGLLINKVDNTQLTNYATINYVDDAIDAIDIPTTDLTDYYDKTEVNSLLINKVDNTQLSNYATINYVDDAINNIDFPETDLSNYYNKNDVNGLLINKVDNSQLANYATITQLDAKANQLTTYTKVEVDNLINSIEVEVDLTDYYNKNDVNDLLQPMQQFGNQIIVTDSSYVSNLNNNNIILANSPLDIMLIIPNGTYNYSFVVRNMGVGKVIISGDGTNTIHSTSAGLELETGDITSVIVNNSLIITT